MIQQAIRMLESRVPRSLLQRSAIQEVYLLLTGGVPFKVKPVPRKRPRGGKSPSEIARHARLCATTNGRLYRTSTGTERK